VDDDQNGPGPNNMNSIVLIVVGDVAVVEWPSAMSASLGRERSK
jgi:hypothetical protein